MSLDMRIRSNFFAIMFVGLVVATGATPELSAGGALSCSPKNSLGYVSQERCEVCNGGVQCLNAVPSVEKSQRAAAVGDLDGAITAMEEAVGRINRYTRRRIQRWDNLAELYCLRAAEERDHARAAGLREDGMRMLNEYRCGLAVLQGREACALAPARVSDVEDAKPSWGRVPNPALTPLCFASFCDVGFQNDDDPQERANVDDDEANRWDSFVDEPDDIVSDAANLKDIERLCRRPGRK